MAFSILPVLLFFNVMLCAQIHNLTHSYILQNERIYQLRHAVNGKKFFAESLGPASGLLEKLKQHSPLSPVEKIYLHNS